MGMPAKVKAGLAEYRAFAKDFKKRTGSAEGVRAAWKAHKAGSPAPKGKADPERATKSKAPKTTPKRAAKKRRRTSSQVRTRFDP